jgi:hypothetical protein
MAEREGRLFRSEIVIGVATGLLTAVIAFTASIIVQTRTSNAAARLQTIQLRYSEAAKAYSGVLAALDQFGYADSDYSYAETSTYPSPEAKTAALAKAWEKYESALQGMVMAMRQLGPYLNPTWRRWLETKAWEFAKLSEYPHMTEVGNIVTPTPTPKRDRNVVMTELEQGLLQVLFDWQNEEDFPPTPEAGSVPTPRLPNFYLLPTPHRTQTQTARPTP